MEEDNVLAMLEEEEPGPAQRRRNKLRRRIFAEAIKLFYENGGEEGGGHENTTAEAIADRSDISVRSFFRYFQTKTDAIYVDLPTAMEDHLSLTEQQLGRVPPERAILASSVIQLTEALNDPDDADRLMRAATSMNFIERRGSFSIIWRSRLAELIEPHLDIADPDGRRLKAKTIAAATMQLRDLVIEEWAISGGRLDPMELFDRIAQAFSEAYSVDLTGATRSNYDRRHTRAVR